MGECEGRKSPLAKFELRRFNMRYRLSKFTHVINVENGDVIVYNTFTGKQCFLYDEELKKQIFKLQKGSEYESELDQRLIEYFCCLEESNENIFVLDKVEEYLNSSESLSLIIFPTLDCNFKCSYCYENREKGIMSEVTFDNIYSSIVTLYNAKKFNHLKLEWFGGEPLLCFEQIINFEKKTNEFCCKNNITFQHSMTTNGYLLSKNNVVKLLKHNINTFQITIDGAPTTHDIYRPLRNGSPTWKTIINNLIAMRQTDGNFNVLIRVNYNYEILDSIEEFLDIYKKEFSEDKRYGLIFKPIGHWGGENDATVDVVPTDYHSFILDELLKVCKAKKLNSFISFDFSCGSELCYANKKYSYVIYKNGYIGKCTLEEQPDENSDYVIGNINSGFFDIDKTKENKWLLNKEEFINYLDTNGCFDCIAYPFCCGTTCPAHRVNNGFEVRAKCTPTKNNIDSIVSLNYEISKK